jgi:tetratricopeptide (TPR) repeat protein
VPLTGEAESVTAWNTAYREYLAFRGDPATRLAAAMAVDPTFAMGSVFRGSYAVLAGMPPDSPVIAGDLRAASGARRRVSERERGHVDAFVLLTQGEFDRAAECWESVARRWPRDLAAIRFAHDVYLHVGNDRGRFESSRAAVTGFDPGEPQHGYVMGQLAFANEEMGRFDDALAAAHLALAVNADDMWALHAAAHVHEMRGATGPLLELLDPGEAWPEHDLLAAHLWWHRAIRLVADRRIDEALAIADRIEFDETTAFTLADHTSLLVRLDAAGADVADRWERNLDCWRRVRARHTVGFLEMHAALAGRADPGFWAEWSATLASSHRPPRSQNDRHFVDLVGPLTDAIASLDDDRPAAVAALRALGPGIERLGGSLAQRQVIDVAAGTDVVPVGPGGPGRMQSKVEP